MLRPALARYQKRLRLPIWLILLGIKSDIAISSSGMKQTYQKWSGSISLTGIFYSDTC